MNSSKATFEPLNDIKLLQAQFSLSEGSRQSALLAFDLFETLDVKDLVEMPFAGGDWPSELLSQERLVKRQKLSSISTQKKQSRSLLGKRGSIESIHTLGNVRYLKAVQQYMLELIFDLPPHHICWDYLEREIFLKNLSSDIFVNDRFSGAMIQLLHSFIWVTGEERRVPVI